MSSSRIYLNNSLAVAAMAAGSTAVAMASLALSYSIYLRLVGDKEAEKNEKGYKALKDSIPPKTVAEFEAMAMKKLAPLSKMYFQYFSDPNSTTSASRAFFLSLRLLPRILQGDVETVDTSLTIFGQRLELPVLIAPSAFHVLACPEGEVATARGAGAAGAGYCYNFMLASKPYQDVLKEDGVKWLHLYMFEERDLVEASIEAALASGDHFSAIILTCDHPHQRVQGRMIPYFMRGMFPYSSLDEPFFPNQAAVGFDTTTLQQLLDPEYMGKMIAEGKNPGGTNSFKLDWEDVRWIQEVVNGKEAMSKRKNGTKIPIVAKGILSAADARKALEVGVDAIVVSNHGGRQCDFAVPAIEALPVVTAEVRGRVPVFVDSGVRTSSDIVRALCLGATGVLLGRPALWALSCEGSDGLERMLTFLKEDLKDDLRSLGVTSISQLDKDFLWPPDRERIQHLVELCSLKFSNLPN
jgi:4-hydroxymandelate oxidase